MPPELLPEVPDLNLLGQLFELRTEVEIKLRKAIIFYLGVHRNWDAKEISSDIAKSLKKTRERPDPTALFVGNTPSKVINELYLLDLKNIISENWEIFQGLFNKNKKRFEMNMDTINIARRVDAHTKPLTDDEVDDFRNSYGWIKRHLIKIPEF